MTGFIKFATTNSHAPFMKRFAFLCQILIFVLLVISCKTDGVDRSLSNVENIIKDHPDSALNDLTKIDTAGFSEEQKARFSLLLSQALFRNGYSVNSDSIIRPALDYYEAHGTDFDKMLSHYYYGEALREYATKQEALLELEKAANYGRKIEDKFYLARMLTTISSLNQSDYNGEDGLKAAQESKRLYHELNDVEGEFYADVMIACAYQCINRYEESKQLFKQLYEKVDSINPGYRVNLDEYYATLLLKMGDVKQSRSLFDSLYVHHPEIFSSFNRHIYAQLCLFDKDYAKAKEVIDSARPETFDDKCFIFEIKSRYYRALGDYERALQYSDSTTFYNDKDMVRLLGNNVVKYQRDQNHIQLEDVSDESAFRLNTIIVLIIVIIILAYIGYSIVKIYRQKQKNLELKAMELAMIFTQENSILREDNERFKSRIAKQGSYMKALRDAYQRVDSICNSYFRAPEDFKQKILLEDVEKLVRNLSSAETVEAFQLQLESLHPGLFKALRSDFKLKDRSHLILTYTLSGFSYFTTAYILKEKPGAVATQIHRLKRRILHSDSPNLPLYRQAFGPDDADLPNDNTTE